VVGPHREALELGRGAGVLAANRDRVAASQTRAFAAVARDWLGAREECACGPWWPSGDRGTDPRSTVDALALRGRTPAAAATAVWGAGIDAAAERGRVRETLAASPYGPPDETLVLAREGPGMLTPADLAG
jgi:uncharacterized protein